jgi:hypothetical protein
MVPAADRALRRTGGCGAGCHESATLHHRM